MKDQAVDYLTAYANTTANDWFKTWQKLSNALETKYALGNVNMSVPKEPDAWKAVKDQIVE